MPTAIRTATRLRDQDDVLAPVPTVDNGKVYVWVEANNRFELQIVSGAGGFLPLNGGTMAGNITMGNNLKILTDQVTARDTGGLYLANLGVTFGMLVTDSSEVAVGVADIVPGISAVRSRFQISDANSNTLSLYKGSADIQGSQMEFIKRRATSAYTIVLDGDRIGGIYWGAADGTKIAPAACLAVNVSGAPSATAMPGNMIFYTTPAGSQTLTEAMRIDNAQNLIIANGKHLETQELRASPAASLQINGVSGAGSGIWITTVGEIYMGTSLTTVVGVSGSPKFTVGNDAGNLTMMVIRTIDSTSGPSIEILHRRTTAWKVLSSGDRLGTINFCGSDSIDAAAGAAIYAEADGPWSSNNTPTRLMFGTTAAASVVEAMRITYQGIVRLSTTGRLESTEVRALTTGGLGLRDSSGLLGVYVVNGGHVSIGSNAANFSSAITAGNLYLNGDTLRIGVSRIPATSAATGVAGEICWGTGGFLYFCIAANTWRRLTGATF